MGKGKLVIISGPSGVGKGTIIKKLLKQSSKYKLSVSWTTRKKRPKETNGKEYFFVTKDEFKKKIAMNGFLEHAIYESNYYGTPIENIKKNISKGYVVILEIEVKGAISLIKKNLNFLMSIFIIPPSLKELENRLIKRETNDYQSIKKRMKIAKWEMKQDHFYDYTIINDKLENAIKEIIFLINKET